jgi:hypothetical protein
MVREANNFRQRLYPVEQLGLPSRPRFECHPRSSPRYAVRVAERDLECEVGLAEGLWPAGPTDEACGVRVRFGAAVNRVLWIKDEKSQSSK